MVRARQARGVAKAGRCLPEQVGCHKLPVELRAQCVERARRSTESNRSPDHARSHRFGRRARRYTRCRVHVEQSKDGQARCGELAAGLNEIAWQLGALWRGPDMRCSTC